jgi:competence protein ComEC
MRLFVAAFAAGIWLLQQQDRFACRGGFVIGSVAARCGRLRCVLATALQKSALALRRFLATGAAGHRRGVALASSGRRAFAHWRLADELPQALEGRTSNCRRGRRPAAGAGTRCALVFDVEQAVPGVPPRMSLAWYRGRDAEADESLARAGAGRRALALHGAPQAPARQPESPRLRLRGLAVRARHPRHRLRAAEGAAERIEARVWRPGYAVEMLRESIRDRFRAALPDAPYAGILIALAIGDQQAIAPDLWQSFARTGITHLMSISACT